MMRLMIFVFLGVVGLFGIRDGTYSLVSYFVGISVIAFLFWGIGLLFGGDGLVNRIRYRNKLSMREKVYLEFLREFNSLFLYRRSLRDIDVKDFDKVIEEYGEEKEYWTLQKKFSKIRVFISKGRGSEIFREMAQARMWKMEAYADEQAALNLLG